MLAMCFIELTTIIIHIAIAESYNLNYIPIRLVIFDGLNFHGLGTIHVGQFRGFIFSWDSYLLLSPS